MFIYINIMYVYIRFNWLINLINNQFLNDFGYPLHHPVNKINFNDNILKNKYTYSMYAINLIYDLVKI